MLKVLVTGCAGFIGSQVTRQLLDVGHLVQGVDNLNDYYHPYLKHWRLNSLVANPRFTFHHADVNDPSGLRRLLVGAVPPVSSVFHLAAWAGVRRSVDTPRIYYETNLFGTLNLLELCREFQIRRFILASSSSVYGDEVDGPVSETIPSNRPLSPYAASKVAAETLLYSYHHLYGMDAVAFRFFTVYGPAGRPDMSVFRFIRAIAEREPITIYGDGTQRRDFTYVDDVARGAVAALGLSGFEIINLGNDNPVSVNTLVSLIESTLGCRAEIQHEPRHSADPTLTWANIDHARRVLGWSPEVSMEEGINRTCAWYLENRDWARSMT